MSASQTLGGPSRCGRVLGPSLDKIIKNAAWRKHSHLVSSCKSVLDKLETLPDAALPDPSSPLLGLSSSDADFVLNPILLALDSNYAKVADPALECVFKLFSAGVVRGEIDGKNSDSIMYKIVDSVCKVGGIGEESVELAVLRALLSAVRCPCVLIRGDCLLQVVRTLYNIYLGVRFSSIMLIIFSRADEDSMDVSITTVSVSELLEFTDKNLNEGNSIYFCQNFVSEVMSDSEGVPDLKLSQPVPVSQNGESKDEGEEIGSEKMKDEVELCPGGISSKIREDGFIVFKNLCKLSMKFSSQENPDDQVLLRGKTLSLELLKVIMDNGGSIWCSTERFLNAIKQFLCLSLLKNSALSVMSIFQLQCSIFMSLLTKYRSGLKAEIGIFFPMLILRVLENVLQPSFLQKMTILDMLEKIAGDSQIIIDIFVNYDCDVDSPNIFERIVNGLLKTALGPPPGSTTTLSAVQDITFRHESVKCLVGIIKSMGAWMDQQLKIGDSDLPSGSEKDGLVPDYELHLELNSELSDSATLEQRRAYKIELQKGVQLFNKKPSKGIEFLIKTKKVGNSPEEVASFLKKNTAGLNETMIGCQERHRKLDRIMEKFAERYCKCNPNSFTSADTAYVLAYSVIMLNTDAHNSMMTKSDFIRNNRGIDDGKDLPEEYLGALYDQIVKNEIKINADSSVPQSKQANSLNKLLGLDGILNLVSWKQTEEKPLGANGHLIRHIQEQFKAKSGKSESVYHAVCWGPMLAAFSVTLDQSDDRLTTTQCILGFRYSVHVTAVMGLQTQRDAFVTSAIISIAIEDGNHLQEAWEHILTCLSRIEHLQLLGEGATTDASFLSVSNTEQSLMKKGTLQNPAVMAVVLGINHFIANLNLLDQIGNFELNHVFAHSQQVNSEAIVAFVKALCKVSMLELQSSNRPSTYSGMLYCRHYNMNRIRLVWSRMWNSLSVAIFVMDSLRQLAMKSILRPFVIIMQKSNSAEIRELIVRCMSQMVLSRVTNVKSGWKSVLWYDKSHVFTAAAADERKNIVLLAFETMEKIVREYFPHITETDATFTNSRFNNDASLNAIAFLRFCAVKLAEGGFVCTNKRSDDGSSVSSINKELIQMITVIFSSRVFWVGIFNSVILPIFDGVCGRREMPVKDEQNLPTLRSSHHDGSTWDAETSTVAAQCLVDLYIGFYSVLRPQLSNVLSVLTGYLRSNTGSGKQWGCGNVPFDRRIRKQTLREEWREICLAIKEAAISMFPGFMKLLRTMDDIEVPDNSPSRSSTEASTDHGFTDHELEDANLQTAAYVVSKMKSHIAIQLLIMQVIIDMYKTNLQFLSAANINIIVDIVSSVASHAQELNSETTLRKKIQKACSILELSDPPLIYLNCTINQNMVQISVNKPTSRWVLPLGSAKRELAARTSLLVSALKTLSGLEGSL
ncbi:hypothetical protein V6Z11_1Z137600 [Gossypium hirsutum]